MGNKLTCLILLVIIHGTGFLCPPLFGMEAALYVTWDGFEVDKLASMWLIKRHISPGAAIKVLPKGTPIEEGVPFDAPDAGMGRKFNQSSFDNLMAAYHLEDPKLKQIALLVRDIELNTWEAKRYRKSSEIELYFFDLVKSESDREVMFEKADRYFDALYRTDAGILEENAP
ncbi:hypothetical protein SAMN02745216_04609 [Desulfatibacillum alkenivorans DSM 16219]|uniref:ChrB C-terminal domain-containing protein n=1 Tax=Desulfatibacillum alkenivorans DSM 16219 TaxID=1121393 RepID=A0A1M6XUZ0_9BACT|nr:chromate resistance protein ChrB domain-containing protein [Desulfatibacillum alkenivorans]SHL09673.1 hypothetical protein SAMN02745216_04609 [Desulfatibacillum alkenivorans DSM 16219]